jgi:thioredoxin reductase (NADPH)
LDYHIGCIYASLFLVSCSTLSSIITYLSTTTQEFKIKDGKLDAVIVQDRATGEIQDWHPDGVFVFIGLTPNTGFLPESIQCNEWGFLETDMTFMTSMQGVFAAGDVRAGSTKQAISAAGEGATAAMMIRAYLKHINEQAENAVPVTNAVAG